MKISEMVAALEEIRKEHGDIPVCLEYDGYIYEVEELKTEEGSTGSHAFPVKHVLI